MLESFRHWVTLTMAPLAFFSTAATAHSEKDKPLPKNLTQEYLLEEYAKPASNFAYLNHTMVHYQVDGEGPTILLIHGSMQDLYDWEEWVDALAEDYRVVRMDLPGAGLTGLVKTGDYSIDNTMRTVDALMDKLGAERFGLVGTSLGGVVAFRYAGTRPDRVAALILMNSAGVEYGNANILPPQPRRYDESLSDHLSRGQVETLLKAVYVDPAKVKSRRVERSFEYQRRLDRDTESKAIVSAYDRGQPGILIGKIKAPTLVLWGGANRALDPRVADEFLSMLSSAKAVEKVVVPNTGHWMHVEAPTESVVPAKDFLDRRLRQRVED